MWYKKEVEILRPIKRDEKNKESKTKEKRKTKVDNTFSPAMLNPNFSCFFFTP